MHAKGKPREFLNSYWLSAPPDSDDDLWFCGSSAIIDPRGVVIAAASADREELIHTDLSEELVRSVRSRVESFAHRREDLYG
jgi:predicted amidohydrolase